MNITKEKELPGLTLYVKEQKLTPCAGQEFKSTGFITLRAEVHDLAIWDKVVERLEGFTVHSVTEVTEAVVMAAQRRANRAEKTAMSTMEQARTEVDRLEADNSFLRSDYERMKGQLAAAATELQELQMVVDAQDAALEAR